MKVEFVTGIRGGRVELLCIRAGDVLLEEGARLDGELGIDGWVDDRLLRVLTFLALRRLEQVDDGWVDAEDLAWGVQRPSTAGRRSRLLTARAISKFLERILATYRDWSSLTNSSQPEEALRLPESHLIQYWPRGKQTMEPTSRGRGGISRGPYRLGAHARDIIAKSDELWSYLFDVPGMSEFEAVEGEPHAILALSDALEGVGSYAAGRRVLAAGLRALALGACDVSRRDRLYFQSQLQSRLANLDMEMGNSRSSARSSIRAAGLQQLLGDPLGAALCYRTRAHALRQQGDFHGAAASASTALSLAKYVRNKTSRADMSHYYGVLGQQLAYCGRHQQASRQLAYALRASRDLGSDRWVACWHLRAVENLLKRGRLVEAERELARAQAIRLNDDNLAQDAVRSRVTASFLLATGSMEQGHREAKLAWSIGMKHQMRFQLQLMNELAREHGLVLDDEPTEGA